MTYRGGVRRWYLTPRWLALHAIALVAMLACARLGWWQLDRSLALHEASRRPVPAGPAVPADQVMPISGLLPTDDVGQRVRLSGRYDARHQLLVRDRPLNGHPGYLVLTPLVVADGPAVPVARGWLPEPADSSRPTVPAPPSGLVHVTGWVAGADPMPDGADAVGVPGEITAVNPAVLVNAIPYPVRSGYVNLSTSKPAEDAALVRVPRPEFRTGGSWPIQNITYVAEWWAFGLAAIWFWATWLRQDAADQRRQRATDQPTAGEEPAPSGPTAGEPSPSAEPTAGEPIRR